MSKHPFFVHWMSLPLATVLGVALTMTAQTQVLGGEAARLDGFTQADGGNVFALTLKPNVRRGQWTARRCDPGQYGRQPDGRLSRQVAGHAAVGAVEARCERSRQARGLRPERGAADPRVRGPQQSGDGRGAGRARPAHPARLLRPGEGPGHCREELRGRQQVAAGRRLYRRRQQPCQPARHRSTRPRRQRPRYPAGAGDRLWSRSPDPRAVARRPGLPHRRRRRARERGQRRRLLWNQAGRGGSRFGPLAEGWRSEWRRQ